MRDFIIRVDSDQRTPQAWARLWDLQRHTEVIPLTTVALDPPATALAEGAGFTGRTALGPLAFDDTMRVEQWVPPTGDDVGRAVVVKTGRLLGGRIHVEVAPTDAGARITWRQSVVLAWLPAPLRLLEAPVARLAGPGYRLVLRRLLA